MVTAHAFLSYSHSTLRFRILHRTYSVVIFSSISFEWVIHSTFVFGGRPNVPTAAFALVLLVGATSANAADLGVELKRREERVVGGMMEV